MQLNLPFEQTAVDFGVELIYSHLEHARQITDQLKMYKRNGHIALDGFQFEQLLCDMFRTEFHRQFLWGYRASIVECEERFAKLGQIVKALARKCELQLDESHV